MWNPWRGCHKYSEGCKYCYIHKGDTKRGVDTNIIVKTDNFNAPIAKNKKVSIKLNQVKPCIYAFLQIFLLKKLTNGEKNVGK